MHLISHLPKARGNKGVGESKTSVTHPKRSKGKSFNLSSNIILIVGITVGVLVILLLLAFAIYKYKSRDEGSYKVDESKNYMHPYQEGAAVAACNKPSSQVNGGSCTRSSQSGMQTASKPKKNVKEWYVWCTAES